MANELILGTRRQGNLVDFDASTPEVNVILERTDEGIRLEVPWANDQSPYASWFIDDDFRTPGAPAKSKPPRQLLFQDSHGPVLLVGCTAAGYHMTMFGPGTGSVWATHAILDVTDNLDFQTPNGLRSEISGLRSWLGVTSFTGSHDYPKVGQNSLTLVAKSSDEIVVDVDPPLKFIPTWRLDRSENSRTIHNLVICESRSNGARDWRSLEEAHLALRDLLVISQWRAEISTPTAVLRDDDELVMGDGTNHGARWRTVISARPGTEPPEVPYRRHLIKFEEIGIDGLRKWFLTREAFARALDPVISTRYLNKVSAMTVLAQSGPGLEALGYLLLRREGLSEKTAGSKTLRYRLDRILTDVEPALPFDGATWAATTVTAYNALKHANRIAPEPIDMINSWRQSVLVVRAWVALELGTAAVALRPRLSEDPQAEAWLPAD
ncbi:MAG: phosphonomutase [Rhodoglobus sp.]|nr:phosphonomutase [Rhodoglobus sp.]